jgi:ferric iron reductase protein FhuF
VTPATTVEAALDRLTGVADWMRWRVAGPGEPLAPGELACADLAASPGRVAEAIATGADARGTGDPTVLASLWWQGYGYRTAGVALACWLLTGVAPDCRAEHMAVGVARGRPSSTIWRRMRRDAGVYAAKSLCDHLFAGHLDLVAGSLPRIGRKLVWGNVAAACASGAGAVREAAGPSWHDGVAAFLAAAPHGLAGLGAWEPVPPPGEGWAFHRRTCCLWWKTTTSGGALCADCSLHRSPDERPA